MSNEDKSKAKPRGCEASACSGLLVCAHCGELFDSDECGNYDGNTNLAFCWAECEMNYDRAVGLPDDYEIAN